MKIAILIMAAGSGSRLQSDIPKQYIKIADKAVISHTIAQFAQVGDIYCVINRAHQNLLNDAIVGVDIAGVVYGGQTRQESVKLGLLALQDKGYDFVLIHDAARPLIAKSIIKNVLEKLEEGYDAVDVGIDLVDTIKYKPSFEGGIIDRKKLYATQTPQGFNYNKIMNWHLKAEREYTDDISIALDFNGNIALCEGMRENFKITTPFDLQLFEFLQDRKSISI
jgi:2-C-methyl-D-erythritol 4-phosphate cytidylyltransferase